MLNSFLLVSSFRYLYEFILLRVRNIERYKIFIGNDNIIGRKLGIFYQWAQRKKVIRSNVN